MCSSWCVKCPHSTVCAYGKINAQQTGISRWFYVRWEINLRFKFDGWNVVNLKSFDRSTKSIHSMYEILWLSFVRNEWARQAITLANNGIKNDAIDAFSQCWLMNVVVDVILFHLINSNYDIGESISPTKLFNSVGEIRIVWPTLADLVICHIISITTDTNFSIRSAQTAYV